MRHLYSFGIYLAKFGIKIISPFSTKLNQGYVGRKETFKKLEATIEPNDKTFWFHCASLGEYEQGLPVFEALKVKQPDYKIVLSFFSPSGYEIKKESKLADVVVYMPLDTSANAKRFLDAVHPNYIIFIKYEIWPNFLNEVKFRKLNAILISATFRKEQPFFKWYGSFMTSSLFAFQHIFTQDEGSKTLLKSINYRSVSVSGDTRFDRVSNQLKADNKVPFIEEFLNGQHCVIFGSTWPEDDKLCIDYINKNASNTLKFIITPHNIKPNYINSIQKQLTVKTIRYSDKENAELSNYNVFILDTIGYLNRAYSYANIAYVGGGAGSTGLHNILEPAVFGIPIIIGKHYQKFPEAKRLIDLGGVTSVASKSEFENAIDFLIQNENKRKKQGVINKNFIINNTGAIDKILDYISF